MTVSKIAPVTVLAATLAALGGPPALAAQLPNGGVTAAEVAEVLQAKGYRAEITKNKKGEPIIRSASEGSRFVVWFYGCAQEGRCRSMQFAYGQHIEGGMTAAQINDWNKNFRFASGYIDSESDPNLKMDLDVERGFTTEAIDNNLETWVGILSRFKAFIRCSTDKSRHDECS